MLDLLAAYERTLGLLRDCQKFLFYARQLPEDIWRRQAVSMDFIRQVSDDVGTALKEAGRDA